MKISVKPAASGNSAKLLVLTALFGASLSVVKFCFMYIPNVEAVTLLITVYAYVFGGGVGISAALVFCLIEGLFFGFNPAWIAAYFIHWPFVALTACLLKLLKIKNPLFVAAAVAAVTALFGLQSSFTYFLVGGAVGKPGWTRAFLTYYLSGAAFYITQTVSNFLILLFAFKPLVILSEKLKFRYFAAFS